MNYKRLGEHIQIINKRNKDLEVETLLGVSVKKKFIPSIANTVGTDFKKYKIVKKHQFVYIPDTSRRGEKIGVAMLESHDVALVSQAYTVFQIKDQNKLLSEYLMMWFRRPEFDRYARVKSHGSVREIFDWEEMCSIELPIPSIGKQQQIVAEYNTVTNRINLNNQLNQKLEETAQALYKHWFVDFEFFCLPSDYLPARSTIAGSPHGQINLNISNDELKEKIAQVCTYKRVGGLPISDGKTWFIYLILCDDDSIYKGMTNDLYRRFYEHYTGNGAKHTQQHKPIKVIHWESFKTREEAAKREKELKTGYGRTWLKRQIEKAGGIEQIVSSLPAPKNEDSKGLPAPKTQLRTAGKMVYNEELEKNIPVGWSVERLNNTANILNKKRKPISGIDRKEIQGIYPYYGAMGPVDSINNYIFEGTYLLVSEDGIYVTDKNGNPSTQYVWGKFWVNNHAHILQGKEHISTEYLMLSLKNTNVTHLVTGAAQPKINLGNLSSIFIQIPDIKLSLKVNKILDEIYKEFKFKKDESQTLQELQSLLLAKMTQQETKLQAV